MNPEEVALLAAIQRAAGVAVTAENLIVAAALVQAGHAVARNEDDRVYLYLPANRA